MKTTRQFRSQAKQLFRFCLVDGRLHEERVRRVVDTILQSGRSGYLSLLRHFQRLLEFDRSQHTANVESALPLPTDLQARVRAGLQSRYGPEITTRFVRNPALIGGMRIKVGSDVYDGSVRFGLTALERSFGISGPNGRKAES